MNQGTLGYSLTKKTEGQKSRDTVPLKMLRLKNSGEFIFYYQEENWYHKNIFLITNFTVRSLWIRLGFHLISNNTTVYKTTNSNKTYKVRLRTLYDAV
jgi:hypothetical protein